MMEHEPVDGVPIPRLTLIKTYKISAPVGCHHCQDAPCASACPQNALYINDEMVNIRQDRCIGCSSCILACPFGAIDIVSASRTVSHGKFEYRAAHKPVIIKCDLCTTREDGPACIKACLTDALSYIDEEKMEKLSREKQYAAAQATEFAPAAVPATVPAAVPAAVPVAV
ncbi:MAG: 4Fe-4S dicluster domain-containing protein [Coriobacteriales bacterium]|jgi:electron transport protein HydN|nr:4Fe-4S dicluster domain-containing protein [Coriobacteriales bacterium]